VGAGDCIVHRQDAETHTLIGSEPGLDALAFSSGSDTGMTWLPRANAWWMGPRWLPSDGPNPFQLEAAAGELDLPQPEPSSPPTICATLDLPPEPKRHGDIDSQWRDFGATGSVKSGLSHVEVAPGHRSAPFHCHGAEEEVFVVVAGAGRLRLGDQYHDVRPGHILARPPGTGVAHQFIAGDAGLKLLAWGTRDPNDIVWYPDSEEVRLRGIGVRTRLKSADSWEGDH
jgi:uncharacterized cupin superfamily protein